MLNFIKEIRDKLTLSMNRSHNKPNSSIYDSVNESNIKDSTSLLILGNGFNLDMNFRTRYQDFSTKCLTGDSSSQCNSELYRRLLVECKEQPWADLEQAIKRFAIDSRNMKINVKKEKAFFDYLVRNLGLYMFGEEEYHSIPHDICNPKAFPISNKQNLEELNALSLMMLKRVIKSEYKLQVLSFNYSWMEKIAQVVAYGLKKNECDKKNEPNETNYDQNNGKPYIIYPGFYDKYDHAYEIQKAHFDFNYLHINGSKCVLGTDNDPRIPKKMSFVKKASQLKPNAYKFEFQDYKSIIFFGYSFGECDSDFNKVLLDSMTSKNSSENPEFIIVTHNDESSSQIEDRLRTYMPDISQHVRYSFIHTENADIEESCSKLESYIFNSRISK